MGSSDDIARRRPDVLRTVRGASLTGTRERPVRQLDSVDARPGTQLSQDRLTVLRGPALGRPIRDYDAETNLFDAGRYSEPND